MRADEMTDEQVREQIARADKFRADFCEMLAATVVDADSPCAKEKRDGLARISETLDAVPFVLWCNISNLDAAMRGALLSLIEVRLMAVGGGPTLDFADAEEFFAPFESMVDEFRKQRLQ
jgi:hypothetical protein